MAFYNIVSELITTTGIASIKSDERCIESLNKLVPLIKKRGGAGGGLEPSQQFRSV